MRSAKKSLSLEVLEARALFAGMAAEVDMEALIKLAISSSQSIEASFDPSLLKNDTWRLVLRGTADANVTIDFDKLPASITSISVSQFDTVKFEGADRLVNLYATDVRAIEAPAIDVEGLFYASNVDRISLKSVSGYLQISGNIVEAKIDNLGGYNSPVTPIHLFSLKALTLETSSPRLNFETIQNNGLVIALPKVPSSWDPGNHSTWKGVSGLDNIQSQLRLGTRDITITAAAEQRPTLTPTEPRSEVPQTPETPTLSPFVSEIDLRAFFDRLEVVFNQAGGFGASKFDVGTLKRVVAELNQVQDTNVSIAASPIPQMLLRRDVFTPQSTDYVGTNFFVPIADEKAPVVIAPTQLESHFETDPRTGAYGKDQSGSPYLLLIDPLRPASATSESSSEIVHVTVDPEAPLDTPKLGLMGIISLFVDRAVDLKQYFLNQLSQEVVPGERPSVLLVDPKPVRPVHHQKLIG